MITKETILIQTHNGKIHPSECASIALLTNYYANKGNDVQVIRSREIQDADVYVDLGVVEDKICYCSNGKYWENSTTTFSSAGAVWRSIGKEFLQMYLNANFEDVYTETNIQNLWSEIYFQLIEEIDAYTNDVNLHSNSLNIPDLVNSINYDDTLNDQIQNDNFYRAVSLIAEIFDIKFKSIVNTYFNFARDLEIVKQFDLYSDYLIVRTKIPTIFQCLNSLNTEVKYVIFENENEYTVKSRRNSEKYLIALDLKEKLNNPDELIFAHENRKMAKCSTLESAIGVVNISLAELEHSRIREIYEKIQIAKKADKQKLGILGLTVLGLCAGGYYLTQTND